MLDTKYTHIIHIADIHIRSGNKINSRYDQYIQSFQLLEQSILSNLSRLNSSHSTIILIAGDIFHNKHKIENFGLHLLQTLITSLSNIAPTIIIPGNHDLLQQHPDEPGLLDASLPINTHNLFYLPNTSTLSFNNIGISTLSVKDTLLEGEGSGIKPNLPPFPTNFDSSVETKIALFHGTFGKTKLNDKQSADEQSSYPLDLLNGFDIAVLGDIHLPQQLSHNNCSIAYSGSLIQQNFGENIIDHGYVIWDIKTKTPTFKNIYNDIGYITCSFLNDSWKIKYRGKYTDIHNIISHPKFPKKPFIRIDGNTNHINSLFQIFHSHNITQYSMNSFLENNNDTLSNPLTQNIQPLDIEFNNPKNIIQFMISNNIPESSISLLSKWIDNPDLLLIDTSSTNQTIQNLASKRNPNIQKFIDLYKLSIDKDCSAHKKTFSIIDISFSNTLCYGNDNYINLSNIKNNTLLINGKNAYGKSALYEIICYAIFGQPMKSRECTKYSADFININKTPGQKTFTHITLSTNTKHVDIYREYNHKRNSNTSYINFKKVILNITDLSDQSTSSKTGSKDVLHWIHSNIGTIEDFLKTSMVTQDIDENILKLTPKQIKSYIDSNINIDSINSFQTLIHEINNTYKYIQDSINDTYTNISNTIPTNINHEQLSNTQKQIDSELSNIKHIKHLLSSIPFIDYDKFPKSLLNNPNHIQSQLDKLEIIPTDINYLQEQKIIYQHKLSHKNILSLSNLFNNDTNTQLQNLIEPNKPSLQQSQLDELYQEIKHIKHIPEPPDYSSSDIIQEQMNSLLSNKPNTPNSSFTLSFKSIKSIIKHIKHSFGSLEKCCHIYSSYNISSDISNINGNISIDNLTSNTSIQKDISDTQNIIDNIIEQYHNICESESNLYQQFSIIKHISEPSISLEHAHSIIKEYKKLQKLYKKKYLEHSEISKHIQEYNDLQDKIKYNNQLLKEFSDIEFNPDCSICMKQKSVKKKLQIQKLLMTYKNL